MNCLGALSTAALLFHLFLFAGHAAAADSFQFELVNELHAGDTVRNLATPIGMLRGSVDDNMRGQCPAILLGPETLVTVCGYSDVAATGSSFIFDNVVPMWTKVSFQVDEWDGQRKSFDIQKLGISSLNSEFGVVQHKVNKAASQEFGVAYASLRKPRIEEQVFVIRVADNKFVRRDCSVSKRTAADFTLKCDNGAYTPKDDFIFSKDDGSLLGIAPAGPDGATNVLLASALVKNDEQLTKLAWTPSQLVWRMTEQGNAVSVSDVVATKQVCINRTSDGNFLTKTLQEFVESEEAKAIGTAICTYYSGQPAACKKTADEGAKLSNEITRNDGSDTNGMFHSPPGYDLCRAMLVMTDASITGETSYSGTIVRDGDRNGLDYYLSMPSGSNKRHWINARVQLEFVRSGRADYHECWPPGTVAWSCKGPNNCSTLAPGAKVSLPIEGPGCVDG